VTREFFSVKTVSEVNAGFIPARRTRVEECALGDALGRVSAQPIVCAHDLPGFARSALDGFAVRASDTFGASSSVPAGLTVRGQVEMGRPPSIAVAPGEAVAIPTGGALPDGADAIAMVEHTTPAVGGTVDVLQPVAPGEGVVRADEDVRAGTEVVPSGQRLRPAQLGVLAAAGVTSVAVFARPRVSIFSTGDEVVAPETPHLEIGQVRDATASALAGMTRRSGGAPEIGEIIPDEFAHMRASLEAALEHSDLVVVSAGSSVGARDLTAEVVGSLGDPGIWCHGLAIKPGKPTLLAECGDVPILGLPGNPVSALVVFGLIGLPLIQRIGGNTRPTPIPRLPAVLTRDVPSAPGRLDVVQVRLAQSTPEACEAEPLFAKSSALSVLALADGQIQVPEEASGLYSGAEVMVELHG
jgi:molybdopterin molybdotransferase